VLAGQQHRVARLATVGGHGHAGAGLVRGDQAADRLGAHQRLVGQRHDHGAYFRTRFRARLQLGQGAQRGTQRGSHARAPFPVVDGASLMFRAKFDLGSAGDDEDRVRAACPEQGDAALGEGLAVQLDQRLRPTEPGSLPGGEQHSRDCTAHGPQAYALSLVASIANRE
jgi:hypothetical protein